MWILRWEPVDLDLGLMSRGVAASRVMELRLLAEE